MHHIPEVRKAFLHLILKPFPCLRVRRGTLSQRLAHIFHHVSVRRIHFILLYLCLCNICVLLWNEDFSLNVSETHKSLYPAVLRISTVVPQNKIIRIAVIYGHSQRSVVVRIPILSLWECSGINYTAKFFCEILFSENLIQ